MTPMRWTVFKVAAGIAATMWMAATAWFLCIAQAADDLHDV
jgi:hypothetical protein